MKPKNLNKIAKVDYDHFCLREEDLGFNIASFNFINKYIKKRYKTRGSLEPVYLT